MDDNFYSIPLTWATFSFRSRPLIAESERGWLLIPQQFFQVFARFVLAPLILGGRDVLPARHFKVLAIVGQVFLGDFLGAAVLALIGDPRVVAHAVPTNFQVSS